jgi:hypothetical protein
MHREFRTLASGLATALTMLVAGPAAAVDLGYAGRLVDTAGAPLAGPVDITVRFFGSQVGNDQLGTSTDFSGVALSDGAFQLTLGLSDAEQKQIFGDGSRSVYIEIEASGRVYPRQSFQAVPLALRVPIDNDTLVYSEDAKLTVDHVSISQVRGLEAALAGNASQTPIATSKLSGAVTAISGHGLGALATLSAVTATEIADGAIANADISGSAAIATSKLSGAVTSISGHGLGSLASLSSIGSTQITDGTIADADISDTAAIATSKVSGAVTAISGHGLGALATLSAVGSAQIDDGAITNADISGTAAISSTKVSFGGVPYIWPASQGGANKVLTNDGSGGLSWRSAGIASVSTKTGNYTVVSADDRAVLLLNGSFTVTLPGASTLSSGFSVQLRNIGSERVTMAWTAPDTTTDGQTGTIVLTPGADIRYFTDGSAWYTTGRNGRVATSYSYRYWRLTLLSTQGNHPSLWATLPELRFKVAGSFLLNAMTSNSTGAIGSYAATITASNSDPTNLPYKAFDGNGNGASFTTASATVTNAPPYDLTTPVTVTVDFGSPVAVEAIELTGSSTQMSTPDSLYFSASADDSTYVDIPGASIDFAIPQAHVLAF